MKLRLHTSTTDHEHLWEVANKARKGTKSVTVSRDALMHLIMDHGSLLGALGRDRYEDPDA